MKTVLDFRTNDQPKAESMEHLAASKHISEHDQYQHVGDDDG